MNYICMRLGRCERTSSPDVACFYVAYHRSQEGSHRDLPANCMFYASWDIAGIDMFTTGFPLVEDRRLHGPIISVDGDVSWTSVTILRSKRVITPYHRALDIVFSPTRPTRRGLQSSSPKTALSTKTYSTSSGKIYPFIPNNSSFLELGDTTSDRYPLPTLTNGDNFQSSSSLPLGYDHWEMMKIMGVNFSSAEI
ncbi:hypothetical protein CC2G_014946 [Coprinopsis cinerea AmutBmut pab1-1]|nr:hypothetical protein CC2G_014946 [Coprinopsis cinerea AmutBmut pab1-1]